jgi:glycosyltransferase involved in cell wall biosynthesis
MLGKDKVLVVTHSLSLSGAPKVAVDLCNYFAQRSLFVTLFNINGTTGMPRLIDLDSRVKFHTITKFIYNINQFKFFRLLKKLLSFISVTAPFSIDKHFFKVYKSFEPDIIIYNTIYHLNLQRNICNKRTKIFRYIHENISYLHNVSYKDILILNESICIACSSSVKEDCESVGIKIEQEPIPAALDSLPIFPQKNLSNRIKFLCVGSGSKRKGADFANDFAKKLKIHDVGELFWYGELENPNNFKSLTYLGTSPHVPYQEYDCFLLLSREEPWGIAALEALSAGLIVIGWSHLCLIKILSSKNLAISVSKYDTGELFSLIGNLKYFNIDEVAKTDFLAQFSSKNLYKSFIENK